MILHISVVLCGLIYLCNGQITNIRIEIGKHGEIGTGDTLVANLDDKVEIRCIYDAFNVPKQIRQMEYKEPGVEPKSVYVQTVISEPYISEPDIYSLDTNWDNEPYYALFTIERVKLANAGEYKCLVTIVGDPGNLPTPSASASLEVFANTDKVMFHGLNRTGSFDVEDNGQPTEVKCIAYNGSEPIMRMIVDGEQTPLTVRRITPGVDEYEGTIRYRFTPDQNGKEIKCESEVAGFTDDKKFARAVLSISVRPAITCASKTVEGKLKEVVTIECTITGRPLPSLNTIRWEAIKSEYSVGANEENENFGLESMTVPSGEDYKAKLKVTIINAGAYGDYKIEAESMGRGVTAMVKVAEKTATGPVNDNNGANFLSPGTSFVMVILGCYSLLV